MIFGLGHLLTREGNHVPVQPHPGERFAGGVGLRDLALVMGKDQVEAAAVDVELVA